MISRIGRRGPGEGRISVHLFRQFLLNCGYDRNITVGLHTVRITFTIEPSEEKINSLFNGLKETWFMIDHREGN